MLRQVIQIDEEKCTGCRLCVDACHEGALGIVNGKAHLMRDDFCDGMGDCLPACPSDAITFVEREALPYDEAAVQKAKAAAVAPATHVHTGGCPSAQAQVLHTAGEDADSSAGGALVQAPSRLAQWPTQIKLMPLTAQYYQGAHILIAADCTAFTYASFHEDFMKGKVTLIGCPKLDSIDYSEKLASIFALNDITAVTMCRMEVPCCGGLQRATEMALQASGKQVPYECITFSLKGEIL